ncbi:MAG: hypothetical protein LIP11_04080 [Clostridiales bacterium]|nr:hypothetical protein [Clostridiales bacterium]
MDWEREIWEARNAAEEALQYLYASQKELNSAGNWGIVDMLGGGMMTTFMKHNKMGKAEQNLQQAKYALQRLQKELRDINTIADVHIEVGDFLRFADFFFDGFVTDWLVQSRINDAKRQINDAISKVRGIISQLSVY